MQGGKWAIAEPLAFRMRCRVVDSEILRCPADIVEGNSVAALFPRPHLLLGDARTLLENGNCAQTKLCQLRGLPHETVHELCRIAGIHNIGVSFERKASSPSC